MMVAKESHTLSLRPRRGRDRDVTEEAHLFLVVQAPRPLLPPARYRLAELDEIQIGRGPQRGDVTTERRLRLSVVDGWMSSRHTRLICEPDGWRLVDERSKNGTLVNGVRHRDVTLADGDVIEIGQTFFIYRAHLPTPSDAPARLEATIESSPGMSTLLPLLAGRFEGLARIAASKTSTVLHGPSGTGKELVARAIHTLSKRPGPMIAVNCAALPETLVESELFGCVRGAFSGADRDRDGLIVASSGGTLFLDEIGDLPRLAQAKLLRVLQEQEVRPVGSNTTRTVDLRVIAATHRDLARMAANESFREDLLGRLGEVFELPPLCERREDLGLIIGTLLQRIEDPRARDAGLSTDAIHALLAYAWPRNVRELQKVLERAIALGDGGDIDLAHLPDEIAAPPRPSATVSIAELPAHERSRRDQIVQLLREHGGNITAVARAMGKVRSQVQRWIKRYAIDVDAT